MVISGRKNFYLPRFHLFSEFSRAERDELDRSQIVSKLRGLNLPFRGD